MNRTTALVIATDAEVRAFLARFLLSRGYDVTHAESSQDTPGRRKVVEGPDVLVVDLSTPEPCRLEGLADIKRRWAHVPVIVLSSVGDPNLVVNAMRAGATDFLVKPLNDADLERAINTAISDERRSATCRAHPFGRDKVEILTRSPRMRQLCEVAAEVADTDVPIVLHGESGVGKEVMARFLHAQSARRGHPFVKVNCAALPLDLLESELFGFDRGAFTGALKDKPGKFELAGEGTILLDEIGEMSPQLQVKLLHILQDGEYTRLGGSQPRRAEARVIAATNQNLEQAVEKGTFRADLYFRLDVIRLEIPPLRERREDILPLAGYFLRNYSHRYMRPLRSLAPEIETMLLEYYWPGNIRQLENVIKRLVILPSSEMALEELCAPVRALRRGLPSEPEFQQPTLAGRSAIREEHVSLKKASALAAERAEREIIERTLEELNWNRKKTAYRLSISYKALLNKLHRWGVGGRAREDRGSLWGNSEAIKWNPNTVQWRNGTPAGVNGNDGDRRKCKF